MNVSEVNRRVLHLSYILEARPDVSSKEESEKQPATKKWVSESKKQHQELAREITDSLDNICRQLKISILNYILENDLETDAEIIGNYNSIRKNVGSELIISSPGVLIDLLKGIQKSSENKLELELDLLESRLSKFKNEQVSDGETVFNNTLLRAQLLILITNVKQILQSESSDDMDLNGRLWIAGGIEDFKNKRKNLLLRLKGKRQEFQKDDNLWDLAMSRILHNKLVSFRGLGGYGKTTLARELIHHLIAEETDQYFSEYHLISFKGEKQGDFSVETGKRVSPQHGMDKEKSNFDDVINSLYRKLTQKNDASEDNKQITIEEKKDEIIQIITAKSCLVVLDNYEDIETDIDKEEDLDRFNNFFGEIKSRLRETGQTSCILITSRAPADKKSNQIFDTVDLGGEGKINMNTARNILESYMRFKASYHVDYDAEMLIAALNTLEQREYTCQKCMQSFPDEKSANAHISNAHGIYSPNTTFGDRITADTNISQSDTNWKDLVKKGCGGGIDVEYSNQILRYPIVINYIASQMLQKKKTAKQITREFIESIQSGKDNQPIIGNALVDYVVSKSFEQTLENDEREKVFRLFKLHGESNKIETGAIWDILGEALLSKLRDLKFLEASGIVEGNEMPNEFQFPPLVQGFIRNNIKNKDKTESEKDVVSEAISTLHNDDDLTYDKIMKCLKLIIESNSMGKVSEKGAGNAIHNSKKEILKKGNLNQKENWLRFNEYIESTPEIFISGPETRSTASKLLVELQERIERTDFPNTISSLVGQLKFEITDQKVIDIVTNFYSLKSPKQFKSRGEFEVGDTLIFDKSQKPEIIYSSDFTLFGLEDSGINVRFQYFGTAQKPEEIVKQVVLITATPEKNVYRIIPVGDKEEKIQNKPTKLGDEEVLAKIDDAKLFSARWELASGALLRLNRLLREDISIERLKKLLEGNPKFRVDTSKGSGSTSFWLVKRIPESRDWTELSKSLKIPNHPEFYCFIFKMIEEKIKHDGIWSFEPDPLFYNTCINYFKIKGLDELNTSQIKKVINLMKNNKTGGLELSYPDKARDETTFIRAAKDKFRKNVVTIVGTTINKNKNLKGLKPLIEDMFSDIDSFSTKEQSLVKCVNEYKKELELSRSESDSDLDSELYTGNKKLIIDTDYSKKIVLFVKKLNQAFKPNHTISKLKKDILTIVASINPNCSKVGVKKIFAKADLGSNANNVSAFSDALEVLIKLLSFKGFWNQLTDDDIEASPSNRSINKMINDARLELNI